MRPTTTTGRMNTPDRNLITGMKINTSGKMSMRTGMVKNRAGLRKRIHKYKRLHGTTPHHTMMWTMWRMM